MSGAMSVSEILIAARGRILEPSNWTRGTFARKSTGSVASYNSPFACAWCARGALFTITGSSWESRGAELLLERAIGNGQSVSEFNDVDSTTHVDVIRTFDLAIELAKAEETP